MANFALKYRPKDLNEIIGRENHTGKDHSYTTGQAFL